MCAKLAISTAPSDSIVFITAFGQDATGKYITTVEIGQQIARVSRVPVFGFMDTLLGKPGSTKMCRDCQWNDLTCI